MNIKIYIIIYVIQSLQHLILIDLFREDIYYKYIILFYVKTRIRTY